MNGRARRDAGFTLVELAVVILILSLVTALVLPSLAGGNQKLGAEARKAAAVLRYLTETSTMRKETMSLKFDLDQKTITWTDREGRERTETIEDLEGVELQTRGLVREGTLEVFFAPLGAGEYMEVYLGRDGREMTVTLNPVSGRVKIVDEKNSG